MPKKIKVKKSEPVETNEIEPLIKESTRYDNYKYLCDLFKNQTYKFI